MVARRLMTLMLVMLVIASLSSVLLPAPEQRDEDAPTTTTAAPESAARAGEPRLVRERLEASTPRPRTIRLRVGDQLALRVDGRRASQVEIVAFGQLADIYPPAPARFNLFATRPGEFAVRLLPADRTIGTISVARARPEREGGRERARERPAA